ncbi:MAG: hypothetical protein ACFHWX_02375 [Bacteroidota bacterium]
MNTGESYDDKILKDLFQRSSTIPDESLKGRILERVTENKALAAYEPVISRRAWVAILSCLACLMIYLFTYESTSSLELFSDNWELNDFSLLTNLFNGVEFAFPEFSSSFMFGLLAIIIFGLYFILSFGWFNNPFSSKD